MYASDTATWRPEISFKSSIKPPITQNQNHSPSLKSTVDEMYRSAVKTLLLAPAARHRFSHLRTLLINSSRFSTVAASNHQSPNDECKPPQVQYAGSSSSAPSASSSSSESASSSASSAAEEAPRHEGQSPRQRRHRAEYQDEQARVLQASLHHVVSAFSLPCCSF